MRLKPRPGEKRDNWLLIKSDDIFARPGEDILEEAPESVKSGLTVEEIGQKNPAVWHSKPRNEASAKAAKPPEAHHAACRESGQAARLHRALPGDA